MTGVSVHSRAWRILRHLERFDTDPKASQYRALFADMSPDDTVLGVYRNAAADSGCDVLVSDQGLRWRSGGKVIFVRYGSIAKADVDEAKHEARTIRLALNDGEVVRLPIEGGEGKLRDAWEMLRFLIRVLGDARR